jgi:cytochrome P450
MRPLVEKAVAKALDDLAERGAGEIVDFQEVVSFPLTLAVIGDLLGIPAADQPRFPKLAEAIAAVVDPQPSREAAAAADAAVHEVFDYLGQLIARRRIDPRGDLTSALVAVHEGDSERLSEDELVEMIFVLFSAGFHTTATVLGNGLLGFLTYPGQLALLARELSLVPRAAEEILRWGASVHMQKRLAVRDTEVGGVAIPAQSIVIPLLAAANRDPARFTDPDRFDITRDEGPGLTFGGGIHLCLGAALSRLEISVLAPELARRFPKIELAGAITVAGATNVRKLKHLPVRIGAA